MCVIAKSGATCGHWVVITVTDESFPLTHHPRCRSVMPEGHTASPTPSA
jgi:hypothetical protein